MTRLLTHDQNHIPQMQMQTQKQVMTAYRVSSQIANEQNPGVNAKAGADDNSLTEIVNYHRT